MHPEFPPLAPRLLSLATATGYLSPGAIKLVGSMLAELDTLNARQAALNRACAILDAGQGLSRWTLALRLEAAAKRFKAVGYRRIVDGHRRCQNELELALFTLIETGPCCARKLWDELRAG